MTKNGLKLVSITHNPLCDGWHWEVDDQAELASQVARLAVGHYRHVAKILRGEGSIPPITLAEQLNDVAALLVVKPGEDPWHRDGWLFQAISWIAANQTSKSGVTRPPHMIKAHKGFDGIGLEFSQDKKSVEAVVIFEDKATDRPRTTIREEVWPSIVKLENGERLSEIVQETTALLEGQISAGGVFDVTGAINSIIWKEARSYRVSITVRAKLAANARRMALFKGYSDKAPGKIARRRADTMGIEDLRTWMDIFAAQVINKAGEQAGV